MPLKNFPNIGTVMDYEYLRGVIESIDSDADTCSVSIGGSSYSDVPIYYHCAPDSVLQDNGAIEGAATGFLENHHVVVARHRTGGNHFVIGHIDGVRRCVDQGDYIIIVASKSGDEAFAWDLNTDSLLVAKDTLASVEAQLKAMDFNGAVKKLVPSETTFVEYFIMRWNHVVFELPGPYNQPKFYVYEKGLSHWLTTFDVHSTYDPDNDLYLIGPIGFRPADTYYYTADPADLPTVPITVKVIYSGEIETWTADNYGGSPYDSFERRPRKITWAHSIIRDPDSGEEAGCFLVRSTWYYESPDEMLFAHFLFDKDPDGCVTMSCEDMLPYTPEHPWPGEYAQLISSYPVDEWAEERKEQGIAENSTAIVCFEHVAWCDGWDYENETCPGEWQRELRIFAKLRDPVTDGFVTSLEARAFELINFERANRGIAPITWNHLFYDAAERHSDDMAGNNTVLPGAEPHQGSDGSVLGDRMIDAGFNEHYTKGKWDEASGSWLYGVAFENIGGTMDVPITEETDPADYPDHFDADIYFAVMDQPEYNIDGYADRIVALWMASTEGHREVILADTSIGADEVTCGAVVGRPGSEGGYYWTLDCGARYNFFPGYAPVPTDDIVSYMESNFSWSNEDDKEMMPDIYLI